jgi:hypothetical protein
MVYFKALSQHYTGGTEKITITMMRITSSGADN